MPRKKVESIENPAEPAAVTVEDVQESVVELLEASPEPNEDAIAAHAARLAEDGRHEAETPKRGRGRPRRESSLTAPVSDEAAKAARLAARTEGFRRTGTAIADTLILAGRTLGGADWETVRHLDEKGAVLFDERENLRAAWADMAEEYQWSRVPGWIGAAIATAAYIGPRLTAPSTLSRIDKLKLWWASRQVGRAK